jgi:ribosomal subunit interface protein
MEPSPAVEARIREKAARLERFHDRIVGCHVVVEERNRHQRKGKLYNIRIEISVPGQNVFVGNVGPQNHAHEDVYVAIRDAFDAAGRRLEDHVRRMRGDVKMHEAPPHGRVVRMFPDHGFIQADDGQEIYFHRNSLAEGSFDDLEVGREVRFVIAEKEGIEGPQASTVVPLGKLRVVT